MPNPFEYHKPDGFELGRIECLRKAYFDLLQTLEENVKAGSVSGRYLALAKTALEESCMWATKAIVFERENS